LTLHSDDQGGLAWRGGDWLLLRYLGDQTGDGAYATLDQSSLTGVSNLAAVAGLSFQGLLGNFFVALYADSLPDRPRTAIPAQYGFTTRNLRHLYDALYRAAKGENGIVRPFPIAARTLAVGTKASGSLVPGTGTFFQLTTPAGAATVPLVFAGADGKPLAALLHGQVAVFRLF
jgi:hypothetical protein